MPAEDPSRREFGANRIVCDCSVCVNNCRFMPGYLIPADLARLAPTGPDGYVDLDWAREHLRASSGAIVAKFVDIVVYGKRVREPRKFRVPTLVPAHRPDFSCHWLEGGRCTVHSMAPFGCAFFSCNQPAEEAASLSADGLRDILADFELGGPYAQIWIVLHDEGLTAPDVATKRRAMALANRAAHRPDLRKVLGRRR
jgi:hypothetical protein